MNKFFRFITTCALGLLIISVTGCTSAVKLSDTGKYACSYTEGGYVRSFNFIPEETAEQDCGYLKDNDFLGKDSYKHCLDEFAQKEKIYKSGKCQKILSRVYNNLEGCTCNVYFLEDGTSHGKSCEGKYGDDKCNTDKAIKKLEWMLAK